MYSGSILPNMGLYSFRGGKTTGKNVSHEGSVGVLFCEESELSGGLVDEHVEAGDCFGAGFFGVLQKKSFGGVVNGIKNGHAPLEICSVDWCGFDVWVHSEAGAVDEQFRVEVFEVGE
jgi:hypothetical protein